MAALVSDSPLVDARFEIILLGWEYYPVDEQGRIPEQRELWDQMPFVVFSKEWIVYEARVIYGQTSFISKGTMEILDLRSLLAGLKRVAKGGESTWCFEPINL